MVKRVAAHALKVTIQEMDTEIVSLVNQGITNHQETLEAVSHVLLASTLIPTVKQPV